MGMVHAGVSSADPALIAGEYDRLDRLGTVWILRDFTWSAIQEEAKKDAPAGDWNWAAFDGYVKNGNSRNKKILGLLDYDAPWIHGSKTGSQTVIENALGQTVQADQYADSHLERIVAGAEEIERFCAYAEAAVSRYDGAHGYGRVDAWCIWNEPNLYPRFWTGTRDEFYALTKAAAAAIRRANPQAVIIAGALNTLADEAWVRGFFTSGAMEGVDAFAYHPYTPNPSGTAATYQKVRDILGDYGFANKVWITEVGYPTQGSYGTEVAESRMPNTVVKTITLLAAEGAQRVFWYHLYDPENPDPADSEDWFGLFAPKSNGSWEKKGGADAYALCARHLSGKTLRSQGLGGLAVPDKVQSYYFEGDDGRRCLILWNDSAVSPRTLNLTIPGKNPLLHDPANGSQRAINAADSYTLYPRDSMEENLLFITWE
jgi:hypothetical protein